MVEIGKINKLELVRRVDFGFYADGEHLGEILVPRTYLMETAVEGDYVDVIVYRDSEDRLIATTEKPLVQVGEFGWLRVKEINRTGAFLDWGLLKDLLLPKNEQSGLPVQNEYCLVYVYLDKVSDRVVASTRIDKFLDNVPPEYTEGQEVDVIIARETQLGYMAIINGLHWGMLYKNEIFKKPELGSKTKAYIRKVREDEKIDLSLLKDGYEKIDEVSQKILDLLKTHKGFLPYGDKSNPDDIYNFFGISKKNFKKATGNLFRRKKILITDEGIKLVK